MKDPNDANHAISAQRLSIFERILNEIDRRKPGNRPFIIGIKGISPSRYSRYGN